MCVCVCDYACVCMRSVFCVKVALRRQFVWETELFTLWVQGYAQGARPGSRPLHPRSPLATLFCVRVVTQTVSLLRPAGMTQPGDYKENISRMWNLTMAAIWGARAAGLEFRFPD